ncbi:DUF4197 domain-containing protein [Sphingobacteriales bacterium UPWRP_1]|nr:hypothetical protein BVG80_01395 [Sphingobacteriales bacterium TSM_CSM]PSJ72870.1 DUF4197 domain-containing protein [Sphingobacteriales bacterium UPWRP_1]
MNKLVIVLGAMMLLAFGSCATATKILKDVENSMNNKPVTESEIIQGLKQALEIGIGNGSDVVSKLDGYFKNPKIKLPFPPEAQKVEKTLREIGLGSEVDKVVLSLNRAAEDAAKGAKPIFVSAIKQMTIKDAMNILKGTDNAATEYLRKTTSNDLRTAFKPVIDKSLNKVAATKYWDDVIKRYNQIPLVQKVNPDLNAFVTEKALDGLFYMVAQEEAKIRKDPLARITDLLKRVFKLQD